MNINEKYINEIEIMNKTCNTPDAMEARMKNIIKKYHAREEVLKTYKNGIRLIGVYDKDNNLINEYQK